MASAIDPSRNGRVQNDAKRHSRLAILAFGDLMLPAGGSAEVFPPDAAEAFYAHAPADLVFANLESTLPGTEGRITKEPLIVTDEPTLRAALGAFDVDVVSLSNNHAFDCFASGYRAVRSVLADCGVESFGAGKDLEDALAPCVLERNGVTTGWLGFTARDTDPSHVAENGSFGVNPLEPERAVDAIRALRELVDHVIVSVHWGVEYCHVPAPEQTRLAHRLLEAGARVVLGHHVHVVQGLEWNERGLVAYSLGNATTLDLHIGQQLAIKQTPRTRSSLALRFVLDRTSVRAVEAIPYRIASGRVQLHDRYAGWLLERANRRLHRGVTEESWRRTRMVEDLLLRPLWKLDPRVVRSIRMRHVRKFFDGLRAGTGGVK